MIWQDAVISIANVLFSVSLIFQGYSGFKEKAGPIKFQTSIPTFVGLFAMSFAFWSLGLFSSAAISLFNGVLWFILFIQRVLYGKKETIKSFEKTL